MKLRNLGTNAHNMPTSLRADVPEEIGKNVPTLDEIHRRALEIHIERSTILINHLQIIAGAGPGLVRAELSFWKLQNH